MIGKDGSGSRPDFYSASVALEAWRDPKFRQPVFGANFLEGSDWSELLSTSSFFRHLWNDGRAVGLLGVMFI